MELDSIIHSTDNNAIIRVTPHGIHPPTRRHEILVDRTDLSLPVYKNYAATTIIDCNQLIYNANIGPETN